MAKRYLRAPMALVAVLNCLSPPADAEEAKGRATDGAWSARVSAASEKPEPVPQIQDQGDAVAVKAPGPGQKKSRNLTGAPRPQKPQTRSGAAPTGVPTSTDQIAAESQVLEVKKPIVDPYPPPPPAGAVPRTTVKPDAVPTSGPEKDPPSHQGADAKTDSSPGMAAEKPDQSPAKSRKSPGEAVPPEPPEHSAIKSKPVQSFCVNIANAAQDARYLRQKKELEDLRADIERRTSQLETRIGEFKEWLARRDEFADKARESLVAIYASMNAEAASKQLAELDEETASSVLAKLESRQSSIIMSEMEPKKAARLMEIVSGAAKLPRAAGGESGAAPPAPPQGTGVVSEDKQDVGPTEPEKVTQ